jgi:hypothetical protein
LLKVKNNKDEDKINSKNFQIKFKYSDNFLNFSIKTFKQISNYLNMKYDYNIIKNRRKYKKIITVYSVDHLNPKSSFLWIKIDLKHNLRVKYDKYKPDYLIYDVFGNSHLNKEYEDSIKIAIFTENKIPDFHETDYAISQAHINYLDRCFKYPAFLSYKYKIKEIIKLRKKALNGPMRTKFCAAIISNNFSSDGFRIKFINELNK